MSTSPAPPGWSTSPARRSPPAPRSPPAGVLVDARVVELLRGGGLPKGDALAVARIAGIMGAKRTPDLIPLCHPIAISGVTRRPRRSADDAVEITATVRTTDRTGVEMEALTAVAVAGLDRRRHGQGGRPGRRDHRRPGRVQDRRHDRRLGRRDHAAGRRRAAHRRPVRALVVTASNRAAAGVYAGHRRPAARRGARPHWASRSTARCVVPDGEPVEHALREAVAGGYDVVLTTGGTGLTPDRPHAGGDPPRCSTTRSPASPRRSAPHGRDKVPTAALSRGSAGVAGRTLVVNLPGSTGGVRDGLAVLAPLLGARRRPARRRRPPFLRGDRAERSGWPVELVGRRRSRLRPLRMRDAARLAGGADRRNRAWLRRWEATVPPAAARTPRAAADLPSDGAPPARARRTPGGCCRSSIDVPGPRWSAS